MKFVAPLTALCLCGCAASGVPVGTDIKVRSEQFDNHSDVVRECSEPALIAFPNETKGFRNYTLNQHILGCYRREGDTCVIITARVSEHSTERQFQTAGHELWHCYAGNFHP